MGSERSKANANSDQPGSGMATQVTLQLVARILSRLGLTGGAAIAARKALERAKRNRDPADVAAAYEILADIAERKGNVDEAVALMGLAVEAEPEEATWRCLLGRLHRKRGDVVAAAEQFGVALSQVGPDDNPEFRARIEQELQECKRGVIE